MKHKVIGLALMLMLVVSVAPVVGQDALPVLVVQEKWFPQSQFVCTIVADELGLDTMYGVDLQRREGGFEVNYMALLAAGQVDVTYGWAIEFLRATAEDFAPVNVAQFYQLPTNGLVMLRSHAEELGVQTLADLANVDNLLLTWWINGNESGYEALLASVGMTLGKDYQHNSLGGDMNSLAYGEADAASVVRYNEWATLLETEDQNGYGFSEDDLLVFWFEDYVPFFEDGWWVLPENLEDPEFVDALTRGLAATMHGCEWAVAHPEEAVEIVMNASPTAMLRDFHERTQFAEVMRVTFGGEVPLGYADMAGFAHNLQMAVDYGIIPDGKFTGPEDFVTHDIWLAAMEMLYPAPVQ